MSGVFLLDSDPVRPSVRPIVVSSRGVSPGKFTCRWRSGRTRRSWKRRASLPAPESFPRTSNPRRQRYRVATRKRKGTDCNDAWRRRTSGNRARFKLTRRTHAADIPRNGTKPAVTRGSKLGVATIQAMVGLPCFAERCLPHRVLSRVPA